MTDLDPELAAVVDDIQSAGVPAWNRLSVERARRVEDRVFADDDPREVAFVRDLAFDGPRGEVPVRVYRDDPVQPAPVVVFYHGVHESGALVQPIRNRRFLRTAAGRSARWTRRATSVATSPRALTPWSSPSTTGWRPNTRFRRHRTTPWPRSSGLPKRPTRSAATRTGSPSPARAPGGNLAASVALRARNHDGPDLAHQALCYPMIDWDTDWASYDEHGDGPLLTEADVEWFWANYCRSPVDAANPYASVLRADTHGELPEATVVTAGQDPLRDEGQAYADALDADGTPVENHHYPSLAHGFLSLTDDVTAADEAMDNLAAELRAGLS